MKFTGHFTGIKHNDRLFLNRLQVRLKRYLFDAAESWLKGAESRVPVWSGMAKGSLLEMAFLLNTEIIIVPTERAGRDRIELGKSLGTGVFAPDTIAPTITITTQVPHYVSQEHYNVGVSKSAPWKSFAYGKNTYLARIEKVKPQLPQPVYEPVKIKVI